MANQTLESSATSTSGVPHRRFKPGTRRKLAVILGGTFAGGLVTLVGKAVGIPDDGASTLGGALTAVVVGADELRERRSESPDERLRRLVNGDVYRSPWLIGFYVVLAGFLASNVLALFGVIVSYVTLDLGGFTETQLEERWTPHMTQAAIFVDIPLTFVYTLPIAVMAAHRLRRHAFLYISAAILATATLATAPVLVTNSIDTAGLTKTEVVIVSALGLAAALPAIAIGTYWARRTQDVFAMRKLFAQLDRSDQHDLIELIKTLPRARQA
jgi:hypothetical protein